MINWYAARALTAGSCTCWQISGSLKLRENFSIYPLSSTNFGIPSADIWPMKWSPPPRPTFNEQQNDWCTESGRRLPIPISIGLLIGDHPTESKGFPVSNLPLFAFEPPSIPSDPHIALASPASEFFQNYKKRFPQSVRETCDIALFMVSCWWRTIIQPRNKSSCGEHWSHSPGGYKERPRPMPQAL